jgi:hypothetical protein
MAVLIDKFHKEFSIGFSIKQDCFTSAEFLIDFSIDNSKRFSHLQPDVSFFEVPGFRDPGSAGVGAGVVGVDVLDKQAVALDDVTIA